RLVEPLAKASPTILVFEDIQVTTPSMLDLLETLASRIRDVPLLLLTLARPELLSERAAWGGGLPAYTALPLEPLAGAHSEELARRLLEAGGVSAESAPDLAGTGEGNPLFIEELAASLAEQRTTAGELPTSVRSIVAARLDALPPFERDALLDASVVGKVFWGGALARMSGRGDAWRDALDSLEGRDLIRRDAVSRRLGQRRSGAFLRGAARSAAGPGARASSRGHTAPCGRHAGDVPPEGDARGQHAGRQLVERKVLRGDVAGDLVDLFDDVFAELDT